MGASRAVSIASTYNLKTYYVFIIIIVLNLQHTGVHYTCRSYEKVKNRPFFARACHKNGFWLMFARER